LYTFCCLTKLSSKFWILMMGRVLGGISTSMLFSTFESWYVFEHTEHYGFPNEWIGVTFSRTTFWNGLLAIFAGVLSNFMAETMGFGPVAPFVMATIPLMCCWIIVTRSWPENYGNRKLQFAASCGQGLRQIVQDKKVTCHFGKTKLRVVTCDGSDVQWKTHFFGEKFKNYCSRRSSYWD
jgi:hypothetical protein